MPADCHRKRRRARSDAIKYSGKAGELTALLRILLNCNDVDLIHKIIRKKIEDMEE